MDPRLSFLALFISHTCVVSKWSSFPSQLVSLLKFPLAIFAATFLVSSKTQLKWLVRSLALLKLGPCLVSVALLLVLCSTFPTATAS